LLACYASEQQRLTNSEERSLLLNRRSYLTLAGSAIAAVASNSTASAQTATGYGEGGYGEIPYGGNESKSGVPTIDSFSVIISEPLGEDRMGPSSGPWLMQTPILMW